MTPEDFKIISDLTDRIKRLESKVKALEGKTKRWQPAHYRRGHILL
jgi:hypothetical protein